MTLIKPISFLQRKRVSVVPPGGLPKVANILMQYEDPNTNVSGTTWNDISGLGNTYGILRNGAFLDAGSNSVRLPNLVNSGASRDKSFLVKANSAITVKSLLFIFNTYTNLGTSSSSRDYYWDMRQTTSPSTNAGYFNQQDSIATGAATLFNNGTFFVYDSGTLTTTGPLATTPLNLTNGTNRVNGGSLVYQWLGPNAKLAYLPTRAWLFNFTTNNLTLGLTSPNGLAAMVFGANTVNPNPNEGSPIGIYSVIGWNDFLDATDFAQIVSYFQGKGVLT
jgi:hypothetical protein